MDTTIEVTTPPETENTSQEPIPAPSVFDRAKSIFAQKATLLCDNRRLTEANLDLEHRLETAISERDEIASRLEDARNSLAAAELNIRHFEQVVAQMEADAAKAEAKAADIVASLGVPEAELPNAAPHEASSKDEQIEELVSQINATSDPHAKGRLVAKLKALRNS